ncbi:MAG TPA: hypothetical protein VNW97_10210 [Candidatus Saccharimonadales bacterium]|jgi:hypothetical protein|nr:hypothetical protein [Candidatus Saccharimonadales bacterium]
MRRFVIIAGLALFLSAVLTGCGGSSSKPNNTVTQVVVNPATISLNSGDVAGISFTPENSAGTSVASTVTFSSSNTSIATVSTSGTICGGTWDATFVVCNGAPGGTPVTGSATITATAGGVNSSGVTVTVHPKVSSVTIDPVIAGCTTTGQTNQLSSAATNVHVCSTQALPHDAGAPCGPMAKDITSIAGTISFQSTDASVVTIDVNSLATARNPGISGVFASLSGVSSPATIFRTCMPKLLVLHLKSDPSGTTTTSATMTVNQTLTLEADMLDENGAGIGPAPVSIVSNNPVVASVSATTLTGVAAGGAGVVASCTPPVCGNGLNTPIYSNLFSVTVPGSSPASTVYAASSFPPPSGTTATALPIDSAANTAGTAFNLSGTPNSLVFASSGVRAYLGTSSGLATLDPTTNQEVTVVPGLVGRVIAVNPTGTIALVSNAANDPTTGTPIEPIVANQRLFVFNQSSNTLQTLVVAGAVAGAFSSDGFKAYVAANNGKVYVFSTFFSLMTLSPGGAPSSVAFVGSDSFGYVAGTGASLTTLAACDNSTAASPAATSAPQLVAALGSADQIVTVNSTGLDIATVSTAAPGSGICPPTASYPAPQFIDFGLGAFTARQLLVAANGSRVVVIPAGINQILTAVPGTPGSVNIPLPAGATEGLSGAISNDGNFLWVGVAGTNTVDKVDLVAGAVILQVATSFKKADSTQAPPNLVTLRPK